MNPARFILPRVWPRLRVFFLLIALLGLGPRIGAAADGDTKSFFLPAGSAAQTLKQFAEQSGRGVVFVTEVVKDVRTNAVQGELAPAAALRQLLAGTALVAEEDVKTGAFAVRKGAADPNELGVAPITSSGHPSFQSNPTTQSGSIATGSILGRVLDPSNGTYLERVRLTVEGTSFETFTDADGYYRLSNVPVGEVKLKVFYTGMASQIETVPVTAGQASRHDVSLVAAGRRGPVTGEVVKLDEFVVSTSREMAGAAIAINEQRFAPNQKTVVATDEFGFVPEGNVGEFMKFLPGVTVENQGGYARSISIDGVDADYVPVTVGGFSLASATPGGGTTRAVAIDAVSINNLSRIEVSFSPTPDTQAGALSGSIELVPRSAFERSRPKLDYTVYLAMRDNARDFHKSPGPTQRGPERKVNPGFDFVYVNPVNQRFGFTLSGGSSKNYTDQQGINTIWRGAGTATNGSTFPNTTGDQPYLTSLYVRSTAKFAIRDGVNATFDFKLTANDRLSFGLLYARNQLPSTVQMLTFDVLSVLPGNFNPRSTHGAVGQGRLTIDCNSNFGDNHTYLSTLRWQHTGSVWRANAGMGHTQAEGYVPGAGHGLFRSAQAQRSNVTVSFDDFIDRRPTSISVTDGSSGLAVDPYRLDSYVIRSAGENTLRNSDVKRTAFFNVTRDFSGRVPFSLKSGLDLRQSMRDERRRGVALTYVGADGRSSTTPIGSDDQAAPFLDPSHSLRSTPHGFPSWQRISDLELRNHYLANPAQFTQDANATYRSNITNSKRTEELVSAFYVRGDVALIDGRLKLTGGVRAEQTNVKAEGPLTDPTRNYQRDAKGDIILGGNGRPLPIASDALTISKLTFIDRGTNVQKEYLRLFPSINLSYKLGESLIARAAHYYSIGRPNFNQYAGPLTLPDVESAPSATNRISVNNAGIKPWTARSTNARLEYYFAGVGQVSISGFVREFKNFFGSSVMPASPEFLAYYALDPAEYGNFDVATQYNIDSKLRMSGWSVSYKQALTFLPEWARGVQVFANGTVQRLTGDESAQDNLNSFFPRSASWGVSLDRKAFNLRTNFSYRGARRNALIAGLSIDPGTYNWDAAKLSIDVLADYRLTRQLSLFANFRNVNTVLDENIQPYGPRTPGFAKVRYTSDLGSVWTFGVKGSF